ncbi:unnamed protein product [Adineta ricciae]|uniref:Uncharacterized protein n=1 Tax=Adineta ricciae TaxID=249248 RepID=A0A813RV06_ADIRI|nr:unnamed protein product [Adineta ricciae]CAF1217474.1 unnamed protein product [Adineta ricciae]
MQLVVLLDIERRHPTIESHLGDRVQYYFNQNECIQYVRNQMENYERIDLFLSSQHKNIIGNDLVLFSNIFFHIYYPTTNYISENGEDSWMWIEKFEEDVLWVEIGYAIYRHDWRSYIRSNSAENAFECLRGTYGILQDEVQARKFGIIAVLIY